MGVSCEARKRDAGSGGRSKCMSGRQSVRTRRRVDKSDNSWGHAASRKIHPRAERRRFPASAAILRVCSSPQDRGTRKGPTTLCLWRRGPWLLLSSSWRRWRGESPGVPHAPTGERGRLAPAPDRVRERSCTSAAGATSGLRMKRWLFDIRICKSVRGFDGAVEPARRRQCQREKPRGVAPAFALRKRRPRKVIRLMHGIIFLEDDQRRRIWLGLRRADSDG